MPNCATEEKAPPSATKNSAVHQESDDLASRWVKIVSYTIAESKRSLLWFVKSLFQLLMKPNFFVVTQK